MTEPLYEHHIKDSRLRYLGAAPVSSRVYDLYVDVTNEKNPSYHARFGGGPGENYTWSEQMIRETPERGSTGHVLALYEAMRRHRTGTGEQPRPRFTHHERSSACTFLGYFEDEEGKNYDLYVYEPDTKVTYYTARWGSNSNQYWTKLGKDIKEQVVLPHRAALTAAMMRHKEKMKGDLLLPHQKRIVERLKTQLDTDGPRWAHPVVNERETAFLGRHADTSGDYDLYVHRFNGDRGYDILAARFGLSTNACEAFYRYAVQGDKNNKHITAVREAMRRSEEKDFPMMTLYFDEHGRSMSGGNNIQSLPREGLRDLSSEESIFIDDKLQGASDRKNRMISSVADAYETQRNILRSLGVPAEYLGLPQGVIPLPGPFVRRVIYESPLHAFGLTADHPGFQRPAAPAKATEQEVRARSLFGSDINEAHTKESDDRRERFKMALRHCFPPSMPFDPENVEGGDVCLKEMSLAASELKLSSEPRFGYERAHEGRKHSFEWHFMDRMGRPAFGFQVRFWAEAPTKEEAWKTLEAGVMAFAGEDK